MGRKRVVSSYALFLVALLQCRFLAVAILDPLDFLALQLIRKSLNDLPGSNFLASWDFTSDPCNFTGVYCESDKVVALNLGDQRAGFPGLTGRIDPAIGKLSALTEFSIVPGGVFGRLPRLFSQLKNLRILAITRNFISGNIPASLGRLRSLKTLDLSYNRLTGRIPRSIGTLPELTNLIFCHNNLSGSVPPFLSQALTRLDLKRNALTGSLPDSFPPSLQLFSLSWNKLTGPVDGVLSQLDQLNFVDLSFNRFTGSIPVPLFSFPIINLHLQRNSFDGLVQLSDQVPVSLVDRLLSASLQTLYLQHNYLTGIEINPTAEIPRSISLCIQYNCMVPPVQTPCPLKGETEKTRPTALCNEWKG
ncbi:Transducin family protein / WD-40 repeat family protein isoform 1 [Hibiscus syriacus]|uniref:Transducin family protein / WD-40 repeat family protein isoform 1 n=1 Tax=Hibiscus syriacus TaxID=106335 RepID=A0A6A2YAL5_HIBSY|nr:Transducin family protein / WD-40 repeat family protein isoform 1 [Hibiscus syriacus]